MLQHHPGAELGFETRPGRLKTYCFQKLQHLAFPQLFIHLRNDSKCVYIHLLYTFHKMKAQIFPWVIKENSEISLRYWLSWNSGPSSQCQSGYLGIYCRCPGSFKSVTEGGVGISPSRTTLMKVCFPSICGFESLVHSHSSMGQQVEDSNNWDWSFACQNHSTHLMEEKKIKWNGRTWHVARISIQSILPCSILRN